MKIQYPLTVLTLAAIAFASGAALAGGMPSDEGPEVLLEEPGFEKMEIDRGNNLSSDSLDQETITAIIKSQTPESLPVAYIPAAYVTVVATETPMDAPDALPQDTPKLSLALNSPEGFLPRDHR